MAPSALLAIQNTVIEFADVISEVTGVNVDIMDRDYIRVAGSGFYAPRTGESAAGRVFMSVSLKTRGLSSSTIPGAMKSAAPAPTGIPVLKQSRSQPPSV